MISIYKNLNLKKYYKLQITNFKFYTLIFSDLKSEIIIHKSKINLIILISFRS